MPQMVVGETLPISGQVLDAPGVLSTLVPSWSSDNPAVATVAPATGRSATITAVGVGNCNIICSYGALSDSRPVTVIAAPFKVAINWF